MLKFIQSKLGRLSDTHTSKVKSPQEKDSPCRGYFFISSTTCSSMEARLTMHAFTCPSGTTSSADSIKADQS